MRNAKEFIMCLIAGILLISIGAVGGIGVFAFLSYVSTNSSLEALVPIVNIILYILVFIAGLGGVGVIIGGYLMTTQRFGTGKFVVGIAVGMGIIGLIIQIATVLFQSGVQGVIDFMGVTALSTGGIGIILTIIARRTAKKSE
ncbi:MAG: hypothetical protein ACTSYL_02955 [Candidatus Thorarchaeota archaeon]